MYSLPGGEVYSLPGGEVCFEQSQGVNIALYHNLPFCYCCADIDECSTQKVCVGEKQTCVNSHGSYKCACEKGYKLHDGKCIKKEKSKFLFKAASAIKLFVRLISKKFDMSSVEYNMSSVEYNMSSVEYNMSNVEYNMSSVEYNMLACWCKFVI